MINLFCVARCSVGRHPECARHLMIIAKRYGVTDFEWGRGRVAKCRRPAGRSDFSGCCRMAAPSTSGRHLGLNEPPGLPGCLVNLVKPAVF